MVDTIARLNMGDQIALTRSCADVHNQTKQHPHCGRCSQCIDRRFAILAARLEGFDPGEAYKVDLMEDARTTVIDREIALSYLRNAQAHEHMTSEELERLFPAVLNAVNHLEYPPRVALEMISKLLQRHGAGVSGVMRETFRRHDPSHFPPGSLPNLHGEMRRSVVLPSVFADFPVSLEREASLTVKIDENARKVEIADRVSFTRNATAELLIVLAKNWLDAAGKGVAPLDHPFLQTQKLMERLGMVSEESLRRRINRARKAISLKLASAGLEALGVSDLVENSPWHGYRLVPDKVTVQLLATAD